MLCIHYTQPNMKYIDEAEQIKIDADRLKDKTLDLFLSENTEKHIYIDVQTEQLTKNIEYMRKLQELKQYDNWTLQIPVSLILDKSNDTVKIDKIKFEAIKDCCNRYMFTDLIGQWEVLQFILSLNPSEVYLTNILGFNLKGAKQICDAAGVGIRLYANWAQSAWEGIPAINKFFIRPEDYEIYSEYTSGIEFKGDAPIQEVMYKAYSRGYWYGDLSEIIIGFNDHVDSRRLPPEFGEHRIDCRKRCITGGRCHLCKVMREFSERLEKTDTIIKHK